MIASRRVVGSARTLLGLWGQAGAQLPVIEYGRLSWREDLLQVQLRLRNPLPEGVSMDEASVLRPKLALIADTERSKGDEYNAVVRLGYRLEPARPPLGVAERGLPYPDPVTLNLSVRLPPDYAPGGLLRIRLAISATGRRLRRMELFFNATIPDKPLNAPLVTKRVL